MTTYLTSIECQSSLLSRKPDLASLGKIEYIPWPTCDLLTRLIADGKVAFQDDLHLMVGVGVVERSTRFEPVEATGNGCLGLDFVTDEVL